MPEYEVRVATRGYETYYVEAESIEEAAANWWDGDLGQSEVVETDVEYVQQVEDE